MPIHIDAKNSPIPEVVELERKVAEVARKYANQHGWCSVVDEALAEAGIGTTTMIDVMMDIEISVQTPMQIRVDLLQGLSEEEMNVKIGQLIYDKLKEKPRPFANFNAEELKSRGNTLITEVLVTDMNPYQVPAATAGSPAAEIASRYQIPQGHGVRFTSIEGRVGHVVNLERINAGDLPSGVLLHSLGSWANPRWTEHSTRSENRLCPDCIRLHQIEQN